MYRDLIFDIDGTLLDTKRALLLALQKTVLEVQGAVRTAEELDFFFGLPGVVTLTRLGFDDPAAGVQLWISHIAEFHSEMRLFDSVREVMDELRTRCTANGVRMGVVTSKLRNELDADFAAFDLFRYFDFIVCASDTTKHKPHPEPMLHYLAVSGANPATAIYIGDTAYDMQCAFGGGVSFALASWGAAGMPDDVRRQATVQLASPADLLTLCIVPCGQ